MVLFGTPQNTEDDTFYGDRSIVVFEARYQSTQQLVEARGTESTDTPDAFRQGASALRNARDWTQEKRKELIAAANSKTVSPIDVATSEPSTENEHSQSTTQSFQDSDTSTDELAADSSSLSKPSFSAWTHHCGRHR